MGGGVPGRFAVATGELLCQSNFAEPVFALLDDGEFLRRLYSQLAKYGLTLSGMRWEEASSFGDEKLTCAVANLNSVVNILLERVEVHCLDVTRLDRAVFKELVSDTLQAVGAYQGNSLKTHAFSLTMHGTIAGLPPRDFLRRFVPSSPDLGPSIGTGVAFYYGAAADRVIAALTADLSPIIHDTLFVRIHGVWDAEKVGTAAFIANAESFINRALDSLDLSLAVQSSS